MPIPGPASSLLTGTQYDALCEHVHAQLQQGIERSFNGREEITFRLSNENDLSSSFASTKKATWTKPLSLSQHVALLAEIRHEVGVAGWRVISCALRGNRVHLKVQPASSDGLVIPGPGDIWPDIHTNAQLLATATHDLIHRVIEDIISDGGVSLTYKMGSLPKTCLALTKEQLENVVATVRTRLAAKWTVNQFDVTEEKEIHCELRWKESHDI